MRVVNPTLLLGAFSAAAVFVVVMHDLERTSPGELARVHQQIPELAAQDGCSQCHGGWLESMTESCLFCHEAIAEHLDAGKGLHGNLEPELARSCARCHSDHHGEGFSIVDIQSFTIAGFAGREAFEHARVGFQMAGQHLETACADCHTHADERFLSEGQHRFIGLEQDCASCHEDPHEGRMAVACADCHTQETFESFEPLEHDRFLPLAGAHASLDCRTCHAEGEPHGLETLGHRGAPDARACADCHDSPHLEPFVTGVADLIEASVQQSCNHCHDSESVTSFAIAEPTMRPEEHAFTGFALANPHADVSCDACHAPDADDFEARYPGRSADACAACHEDVHEGQFDTGPFGIDGCLTCHERTHFEPHAFGVEDHARTTFALDGSHAEASCEECHVDPVAEEPRRFAGTPGTCEDCHLDAHASFFDEALVEHGAPEVDTCAECHVTTTFGEVEHAKFDHEGWTQYAVLGAHAHSACESCHPRSEQPDETGRSFGRVAEHFGVVDGCETCHEDPHRGGFDQRPGTPSNVGGFEGCARCHVESSFRVMRDEFDHSLWTGFPLVGKHFDLGCADCHAPLETPDRFGRTWERAAGQACADCHSNPHAGQFRENGATDCARCHQSPGSWSRLAFDHDRDSRFPLEDAHEVLDCGACHKTWVSPDGHGPSVVRYKPLGIDCVDCHGREEGGRR